MLLCSLGTDEPANESNRTLIGKNNQSTGSLKSEPKKQGIFIKVSREDANQVTTSESIEGLFFFLAISVVAV